MNRITDILIATQFSTVVAFACMYLAHLIEAGHILNPNWNFAVWVLLAVAMFFMLLPHFICHDERPDYTPAIDDEYFGNIGDDLTTELSLCTCKYCTSRNNAHIY